MGAILRDGFEAGDLDADGWGSFSTANRPDVVTTSTTFSSSRKDINSYGGNYFSTGTHAGNFRYDTLKDFTRPAREVFVKIAMAVSTSSGISNVAPMKLIGNSSVQNTVFFGLSGTSLRFYRGTFPQLAESSAGTVPLDSEWHVYLFQIYLDNSNGICKIYRDYDFTTARLDISGLDNQSNNGYNFMDQFVYEVIGTAGGENRVAYDDIAINDITMSYSGGSGTLPSDGDIILGQTSGARAIVTAVLPGSTAASGTLQLARVQDSGLVDWSGIQADDPFSTETIDDSLSSNLWSANITGLDKNSGFPSNGYIIALQPNADVVGKIQLANTGGGDNYEDVDDIPPDTVNFVSTSTSGNRDIYEVEDLITAGLTAGDISEISTVTVKAFWQKSNTTLNTGKIIVEHSGVEYDGEAKSPPLSTYESGEELYDKIPDGTPLTATDWNATNVDSLRVGVKFET